MDIDMRFPRVQFFNLEYPDYPAKFDAIFIDPPFWGLPLKQILNACLYLFDWDSSRKLVVTYLARRQDSFLRIFSAFRLRAVKEAHYVTVAPTDKNRTLIYVYC